MKDSALIKLIICLVVDAEAPTEEKLAMLRWLFRMESIAADSELYSEANEADE